MIPLPCSKFKYLLMVLTSPQSPLKDLHIAVLHFNIQVNFFKCHNNKSNETARAATVVVVVVVVVVVAVVVAAALKSLPDKLYSPHLALLLYCIL
jgi:hypothetical protein